MEKNEKKLDADDIRVEFIDEILNFLKTTCEKAKTDGEGELIYRIACTIDDNVDFVMEED